MKVESLDYLHGSGMMRQVNQVDYSMSYSKTNLNITIRFKLVAEHISLAISDVSLLLTSVKTLNLSTGMHHRETTMRCFAALAVFQSSLRTCGVSALHRSPRMSRHILRTTTAR